jgi:hypothetical protein
MNTRLTTISGGPGGTVRKAGSQVIRLLRAACGFIIAMLTEGSCVWAPEIYGQILLERKRQWANPPPGHPEALCPEVPPSPAEIDLWSGLDYE